MGCTYRICFWHLFIDNLQLLIFDSLWAAQHDSDLSESWGKVQMGEGDRWSGGKKACLKMAIYVKANGDVCRWSTCDGCKLPVPCPQILFSSNGCCSPAHFCSLSFCEMFAAACYLYIPASERPACISHSFAILVNSWFTLTFPWLNIKYSAPVLRFKSLFLTYTHLDARSNTQIHFSRIFSE